MATHLFVHVGHDLGMKPGHHCALEPTVLGSSDKPLRRNLGGSTDGNRMFVPSQYDAALGDDNIGSEGLVGRQAEGH